MAKISIHKNSSSQPIFYDNAINCYTKDELYCVLLMDGGKKVVHKYPLSGIFRIIEEYGDKHHD